MYRHEQPYWPDNTVYFLTGTTFLHYPYFQDDLKKQIVLNQIKKFQKILNIPQIIYSIAINHYHLKFYLEKGLYLAKIKQIMHGGTTYEYKKRYEMRYKEMWSSFKTLRIISEEMDWKITGYIIGNLLKHKEVSTFEELKESPFSSFKDIVEECDEKFARDLVYSVIDAGEDTEGGVDVEELGKLLIKPSTKVG